jgi:hypothetical protein
LAGFFSQLDSLADDNACEATCHSLGDEEMSEKRYSIGDSQGWLKVKLEPSKKIVSLIEYLQVEFTNRTAGRDHFKILEGVYKDKLASVSQKSATQSHLGKPLPSYGSAATLEVSISKRELKYAGKTVSIAVSESALPKIGTHKIQIPDFPHSIGRSYLSKSKYALNWFFLGVGSASAGNDRYLHTGRISAGCVTVDPDKWTALYQYLIKRRSGDGKSVGSITIKS